MDLTIEVKDRKVNVKRGTGQEANGPADLAFDPLRLKTIRVFVERLTRGETLREELETLGEHLYAGLLTGDVRDFTEQVLGEATAADRLELRLRLPVSDAEGKGGDDTLSNLPWEYLYCPGIRGGNGFFVSLRADLKLSRYLPLGGLPATTVPEVGTLRVGVVVAEPDDDELTPIAAGEVVKRLLALNDRGDVHVDQLERPTPDRVLDWLKTFKPQVLHFIGHGGFDREGNAAKIVLLDENGESRNVTDKDLGGYFVDANYTPTVVLLHLPQRGPAAVEPNMARLAPALIRAGVPAVVAMQHPFPVAAAMLFNAAFYDALAEEEPIDYAVLQGRLKYQRMGSGGANDRAFGTPVLYARAYSRVMQHAVGADVEETRQTAGPQRSQPASPSPADRRRAAPVRELQSSAELTGAASSADNGTHGPRSPELEGLMRAVIFAGMEAMAEGGLDPHPKATVYGWFKTLDREFAHEGTAADIAEYVRRKWIEPEPDLKLRQVAVAMELAARREAA
jgi:hypothetical protein